MTSIDRFQYENIDGVFASSAFALPTSKELMSVLFFVSNPRCHDVYLINSHRDYLSCPDRKMALAKKIHDTTCSSFAAHRKLGLDVLPTSVFYTTQSKNNFMTEFLLAAKSILSINNPKDNSFRNIKFGDQFLYIPDHEDDISDCRPSLSIVSECAANESLILDSVEDFNPTHVALNSSLAEFADATSLMIELAQRLQARAFA